MSGSIAPCLSCTAHDSSALSLYPLSTTSSSTLLLYIFIFIPNAHHNPHTNMTASDDEFSLPEPFSGLRSKLGAYLASLDECFAREPSTFSSDRAKVIFATSHLRGTALKWAMTHPDSSQGTFEKFTEDLQTRFGNPDAKETAFSQLKKLKQHGSARSYRERFVKYAEQCEDKFSKDPSAKNKWFYRGLKDDVKDALTSTDWEWKMPFEKFSEEVSALECSGR